jgi:hypothetical protein
MLAARCPELNCVKRLDVLFQELKASPVAWTSLGGLGISKLQFLKKKVNFFELYFFQFLVIKTLDPYPDLLEIRIQ